MIVWLSVDPLSDKYPSMSPFMYCAGNPVILIDPDGRKIVVTRIKNDNGKDVVKISVTAKLYNGSSSNYSKDEMNNMSSGISNQIKESFGGEYKNCEVQVKINIENIDNLSETRGDDHLFMIVDADNSDLKNKDGSSNAGASNVGGQVAKLNTTITDDENQLKRTATHEFGHMAGLEHPENESNAAVKKAVLNDKTNIMRQSKTSSGTTVVEQQINKIENENK